MRIKRERKLGKIKYDTSPRMNSLDKVLMWILKLSIMHRSVEVDLSLVKFINENFNKKVKFKWKIKPAPIMILLNRFEINRQIPNSEIDLLIMAWLKRFCWKFSFSCQSRFSNKFNYRKKLIHYSPNILIT